MTGADDVVELRAGEVRCRVHPGLGGRIGSIVVAGTEVLVTGGADDDPMQWGSYPMAPWAGRVRDARFRHADVEHRLPIGLAPHAIHGTTYLRPWTVEARSERSVSLRTDLGSGWPLGGWADQQIVVDADGVRCSLAVTAADRSMPAQVGWHPWFRKPLRARLRFGGMYVRDDAGIPSGELVAPPAGPWDDCFVDPLGPPRLTVPGRRGTPDVDVVLTSDCRCWVVYDRPDHATCVEPQSGPPDGFSLEPEVLAPGATFVRWMRLDLTPAPRG